MRAEILVCAMTVATAVSEPVKGDIILDWNALMMNAIRADNTGPTLSTRNLAILHTAIYDAVNSVLADHQPYQFLVAAPPGTSAEAAAAAAGHVVCTILYPSFRAQADDLYENYIAGVTADEGLTNGLILGVDVANRTLAARADDGANTSVPYIPSDAPGQWRRTPPFFRPPLTPHWRYVRPFGVPDLEPFVVPPPPALDSPEYAESLNEVKAIGRKDSVVRTEEQSLIAAYWSDFSYTAMPPGHWHEIAATIARNRGNSLAENARLFGLLSMVEADAAIVCWEGKFRYNFWRPVTAVQRADEDDNPATEADPAWDHYLPSPPFPAYPSGHSTFSKGAAQLLTHFYGTDAISFTTRSDTVPGVFRSFESLSACAEEVGLSRIYGGFHFSFDNVAGKASGRKVADYIAANYLLPNAVLPSVRLEGFGVSGRPLVRVHGHIGLECTLQASSDLREWVTLTSGAAVPGGSLVEDSTAPTGPGARFYRIMEPAAEGAASW